jgi:hypothetical protein
MGLSVEGFNLKFVSADGMYEAVDISGNLLTKDNWENIGSFNYASPID